MYQCADILNGICIWDESVLAEGGQSAFQFSSFDLEVFNPHLTTSSNVFCSCPRRIMGRLKAQDWVRKGWNLNSWALVCDSVSTGKSLCLSNKTSIVGMRQTYYFPRKLFLAVHYTHVQINTWAPIGYCQFRNIRNGEEWLLGMPTDSGKKQMKHARKLHEILFRYIWTNLLQAWMWCICHVPSTCYAPEFSGQVLASLAWQQTHICWVSQYQRWRHYGGWPYERQWKL